MSHQASRRKRANSRKIIKCAQKTDSIWVASRHKSSAGNCPFPLEFTHSRPGTAARGICASVAKQSNQLASRARPRPAERSRSKRTPWPRVIPTESHRCRWKMNHIEPAARAQGVWKNQPRGAALGLWQHTRQLDAHHNCGDSPDPVVRSDRALRRGAQRQHLAQRQEWLVSRQCLIFGLDWDCSGTQCR